MQTSPTFLGTVQDVQGATISVALDQSTAAGLAFIDGGAYRIGQVGSFVRIPLGYVDLFGIVSQIGAGAVPERLALSDPYGNRWMTVQLVGEGDRSGRFQRGVSQYPTVGDPAHLVTEQDLARVYGRPDAPNFVRVGHLASADNIPALVDVDKLLTRHSAVVGATGSGKSTTVAGLLLSLSEEQAYPSARIIVLDVHGEYASALRDRATVFRVTPDPAKGEKQLYMPYWAMNFDELLDVTFGPLDDAGRAAVLDRVFSHKLAGLHRHPVQGVTSDSLTVDTPVPFSIHQLWFDLHCDMNATHYEKPNTPQSRETWALEKGPDGQPLQVGDALCALVPRFLPPKDVANDPEKIRLSRSALNIRRQTETLGSRLRDPRFDFLFRPGPWFPKPDEPPAEDLDTLLERWIGGEHGIAILDLSGVPVTITANIVGVLLRTLYDALFWARNLSDGARERPLLVVLEEAHAYLGHGTGGPAGAAVRRIVKEGRKYGIGAMVISQRPAEIDETILSQCGTIFAMRLSNATDRAHVTSAVSDNLAGLLGMLPILRTGEAVVIGEAVHLPVRTLVDPPPANRRPDSHDPVVYSESGPGGWNRPPTPSDYSEVLAVWRQQDPRSPRLIPPTNDL